MWYPDTRREDSRVEADYLGAESQYSAIDQGRLLIKGYTNEKLKWSYMCVWSGRNIRETSNAQGRVQRGRHLEDCVQVQA